MKIRIPQITLLILAVTSLGAGVTFLLQPHAEAQHLPGYSAEAASLSVGGAPLLWKINVREIENANQRIKLPKNETLKEVMDEFGKVHRHTGAMIASWLSSNSAEALSRKIHAASGRSLAPGDFKGIVEARFLAAGWQKRVYLLEFPLKSGGPAVMILKIPKEDFASFKREIEHQALLNQKGYRGVPRLAEVVEEPDRLFYFEEWITGDKLTELRKVNAVSPEIRRKIILNFLNIYRETGSLPAGIRPKQIFIRRTGAFGEEAVLIDLGGQALSQPFEILDQIDMWYGIKGRGVSSDFSPFSSLTQWVSFLRRRRSEAPSVRDTLIFETVNETFGPEQGKRILREALTEMNRHSVSKFRFTHDDFEPFFRGKTRLDRYLNLLARRVRSEISQLDRFAEYQHFKLDLAAYLAASFGVERQVQPQ